MMMPENRSLLAASLTAAALALAGCNEAETSTVDDPPEAPAGCPSCTTEVLWAKVFPSDSEQFPIMTMAATADGGMVIAGALSDSMDLGDGPMTTAGSVDVLVARLDGSGALAWVKTFGGAGYDRAEGVAVDATGRIVVGGRISGEVDLGGGPRGEAGQDAMFVLALDPAGGHLWSRAFAAESPPLLDKVVVDAQGDVILAGVFAFESLDLGAGPLAPADTGTLFLARLGPDGDAIWSRAFGAGSRRALLEDLALTPSGEIVMTRITEDAKTNARTDLLVKLDGSGKEIWEKPYQTPLTELDAPFTELGTLTVGADGGIFLAGECNPSLGEQRWCAVSLDAAGEARWRKDLGSISVQNFSPGIALDPAGNIFTTYAAFGADIDAPAPLARKLGPDGATLWSADTLTPRTDVFSLAVDPSGALLVVGGGAPSIDIGTGPLALGQGGFFVAKLAP